MKTYMIEIAMVDCASRVCGISQTDQYAALGVLSRFRDVELGLVEAVKGMEDLKERADSFRFGVRCRKALDKHLEHYSERQLLACEAKVARLFLAPHLTEDCQSTFKAVIQAMVKRAQIRTHTAKPGGEDINLWLDRYHELQNMYFEGLDEFVAAVAAPDEEMSKIGDTFINIEDEVISMLFTDEAAGAEQILNARTTCIFGTILQEILSS